MEKQHMGPSFSTIPSEAVPNSVAIHMARPLAHCQCLKVETAHQKPIGNSKKIEFQTGCLRKVNSHACFCIVPSTFVVYSELGACADYYILFFSDWFEIFSIELLWAASGIPGSRSQVQNFLFLSLELLTVELCKSKYGALSYLWRAWIGVELGACKWCRVVVDL